MQIGDRSVRLDLYDDAAQLEVELDGRRHHDGTSDREHDVRREALLAEHGVLTLRHTHRRLTSDPTGCRQQVLRVSAERRRQLGGQLG